jgi:hypothetical protein
MLILQFKEWIGFEERNYLYCSSAAKSSAQAPTAQNNIIACQIHIAMRLKLFIILSEENKDGNSPLQETCRCFDRV